jgi:hypothetical protein
MNLLFHLGNAWKLLTRAPLLFIGGSLLISVLVVVSFGILIGPLYGSYMEAMIRLQRDGRQPQLKDLFSGLARFRQLFPMFFLALLTIVGFMLYVVPGLLILTMWIYTLPLMAVNRLSLVTAMNEGSAKVKEEGFLKHLAFLLLVVLVPNIFINALGSEIGYLKALYLVLVPPLQFGCVASLYNSNFPRLVPDASSTTINGDMTSTLVEAEHLPKDTRRFMGVRQGDSGEI